MLSSYIEHPRNSSYEGQDSDEDIILLLRAHPVTNISWIIPALLLFFMPFLLPFVISSLSLNLFSDLPQSYLGAFLIINYLLVLIISFEGFLSWYFNVDIVTDRRIIDIDFHSILYKNIDVTLLSNVQEASSSTGGVLGIIFNFGDVIVQTAGAKVAIDMHKVPKHDLVADVILDLVHKKGQS